MSTRNRCQNNEIDISIWNSRKHNDGCNDYNFFNHLAHDKSKATLCRAIFDRGIKTPGDNEHFHFSHDDDEITYMNEIIARVALMSACLEGGRRSSIVSKGDLCEIEERIGIDNIPPDAFHYLSGRSHAVGKTFIQSMIKRQHDALHEKDDAWFLMHPEMLPVQRIIDESLGSSRIWIESRKLITEKWQCLFKKDRRAVFLAVAMGAVSVITPENAPHGLSALVDQWKKNVEDSTNGMEYMASAVRQRNHVCTWISGIKTFYDDAVSALIDRHQTISETADALVQWHIQTFGDDSCSLLPSPDKGIGKNNRLTDIASHSVHFMHAIEKKIITPQWMYVNIDQMDYLVRCITDKADLFHASHPHIIQEMETGIAEYRGQAAKSLISTAIMNQCVSSDTLCRDILSAQDGDIIYRSLRSHIGSFIESGSPQRDYLICSMASHNDSRRALLIDVCLDKDNMDSLPHVDGLDEVLFSASDQINILFGRRSSDVFNMQFSSRSNRSSLYKTNMIFNIAGIPNIFEVNSWTHNSTFAERLADNSYETTQKWSGCRDVHVLLDHITAHGSENASLLMASLASISMEHGMTFNRAINKILKKVIE